MIFTFYAILFAIQIDYEYNWYFPIAHRRRHVEIKLFMCVYKSLSWFSPTPSRIVQFWISLHSFYFLLYDNQHIRYNFKEACKYLYKTSIEYLTRVFLTSFEQPPRNKWNRKSTFWMNKETCWLLRNASMFSIQFLLHFGVSFCSLFQLLASCWIRNAAPSFNV